MNFVALDVESANADMASICQIGIAKYSKGKLVDVWTSLINPEDYFDPINIAIHGITADDVVDSPKFPQIVDVLKSYLNNTICVSHTHFDRVSIEKVFDKYELKNFEITWLDSASVARRTWKDCAWKGYGLANVCEKIGYRFQHHNALEDAKACGQVLVAAIKESNIDIERWLQRVKQPIDPKASSSGAAIKRDGNPEGALYGEVIVFTGALDIPRKEAADLAASIGCKVDSGVTQRTTLLIVGDQDISKLAGKEKSSKHCKVEQLILKGQKIRIIKESDFKKLVVVADTNIGAKYSKIEIKPKLNQNKHKNSDVVHRSREGGIYVEIDLDDFFPVKKDRKAKIENNN